MAPSSLRAEQCQHTSSPPRLATVERCVLPAVRAFRVPFGALGAERAPARVADEPLRLPREPPPASVARPRQLRRARRAQEPPVALHGVQALPRHVPRRRLRTARSAPPRSGGTRPAPRCPREGTGFRSGGRTPHIACVLSGAVLLLGMGSSFVLAAAPCRRGPYRPMPRWPPNARSASGGQRGFRARQGGNAKAAPAAGGFPGCFAGARRTLPGKNLGKHRGPCRASGFRGRLPSRGSVLRGSAWWARPGGREGDPQGPGRREPRGLGRPDPIALGGWMLSPGRESLAA